MFLAIDIGNTTTMIGFFQNGKLMGSFRVGSSHAVTADESGIMIFQLLQFHAGKDKTVKQVAISSVVPPLTQIYVAMCQKYFRLEPQLLTHHTPLDFKILYDNPAQVGADRLANVAAAKEIYGFPAIVVDLGTATTYDVVNSKGDYAGGMIAPGVWTSASQLFRRGSRLFPVKLEKPKKVIGTETGDSIKSGIYYGTIDQIDGLVRRITRQAKLRKPKVIATGGYAEVFCKESKTVRHIDKDLTLKGLQIIFDSGKKLAKK